MILFYINKDTYEILKHPALYSSNINIFGY